MLNINSDVMVNIFVFPIFETSETNLMIEIRTVIAYLVRVGQLTGECFKKTLC